MNDKIKLLAIVLVAQLLLIAGFAFWDGGKAADPGQWLQVEQADVDAILISDRDQEVQLERSGESWSVQGFAADGEKIDSMLTKLIEIEAAWPAATSADAARRFEVRDDNFQRRIRLNRGKETAAEIFLGTSPGFQRVHARIVGEEEIFSVPLSNYEFPVDTDGWLDKSLFAVSDTPTQIRVEYADARDPLDLTAGEEGWLVNGEAANQDVAKTYANRFKTLSVQGLYADEAPLEPIANFQVTIGDDTHQFAMLGALSEAAQAQEDAGYTMGTYAVVTEDDSARFTVATYIAEQLLATDLELVAPAVEPEVSEEEAATE